jgi:hypothetical protein
MIPATVALSLALLGPIPKDLCAVPPAKTLASGHYQGRFFQLGNATGGQAQGNLKVQFWLKGSLEFDVADDGTIKNGKSEAKYAIYASGMPAAIMVAGFSGSGTGTLSHSSGGPLSFTISGDLAGKGGVFVKTQVGNQKGGAGRQGAGSGSTTVTFTVVQPDCTYNGGTFVASIIDETVTALSGKGFQVTKGQGTFSVKASDQFLKRKAELERELKAAEGLLRGGGEDAHGAQAFPRYAKLAQQLLSEPSEQLRFCLTSIYRREFALAFAAAIDRKLAKLAATAADPRSLHAIRLEAEPLAKLSVAIVDSKLDACSTGQHQKIVTGILAKLKQVVDRAARERYVLPDVAQVLTALHLTGSVAPGLRSTAVGELKAYIAKVKRDGPPR